MKDEQLSDSRMGHAELAYTQLSLLRCTCRHAGTGGFRVTRDVAGILTVVMVKRVRAGQ